MKVFYLIAFAVCVLGLTVELNAADVAVGDIVLVANVDVPAASMAKADVESVFLGKSTKVGDKKVTVAILSEGDVHTSFLKNYTKKTPSQFLNSWKKMVFSGKAKMPKDFKTEAEMVAYIAKTSGAIGYVHVKTSQDGSVMTDKVKVVAIK